MSVWSMSYNRMNVEITFDQVEITSHILANCSAISFVFLCNEDNVDDNQLSLAINYYCEVKNTPEMASKQIIDSSSKIFFVVKKYKISSETYCPGLEIGISRS